MNQDEVKQNLLAPAQWLRILIMAGYALALWVLGMVLAVVVITQVFVALITGSANANLRQFGGMLAVYIGQIVAFLVYATDDKPFPFSPFPDAADGQGAESANAAAPAASAASAGAGPRSYPPQTANADSAPSDQDLYGVDDGTDDAAGDGWRHDDKA